MALISKMHPTANWLRVPDHLYRQALERNIANGKPDEMYFWTSELPMLLKQQHYRQQVEDRIAELNDKSAALGNQVQSMVGSLLEEQGLADLERRRLQELLEGL